MSSRQHRRGRNCMQREGDDLDAKIKKAEKEIRYTV
jgi:hypothetical protein